MFEAIGRLINAQPIFLAGAVLILLMMIVGLRLVIAKLAGKGGKPDWHKDPEEMQDLSPALKRARIMMAVFGGLMISLFILGIATMFTGD